MASTRRAATRGILLAAAVMVACPVAEGAERHSGRVVAASEDGRRVTVETLGPWRGPGTGVHTIVATVDPGTRVSRVHRREGFGPGGWPGAYSVEPLSAVAIDVGDFVTVAVVEAQGVARALAIEVLDGESGSGACAPDELLVGFDKVPAPEAAAILYGRWQATLMETLGGLPVQRIKIAPARRADAARGLALHPDVRFVERNCTRASALAGGDGPRKAPRF